VDARSDSWIGIIFSLFLWLRACIWRFELGDEILLATAPSTLAGFPNQFYGSTFTPRVPHEQKMPE
jgi:hypothetical protein